MAKKTNQDHINPALRALAKPLAWFKPDPKNARKHDDANLAAIRGSLETFGQQKPVVALSDGTVIAGNGTLSAAGAAGMDSLAVVVFEDAAKAAAYAIADNRSAELATWDVVQLTETLKALEADGFDMPSLGFVDGALASLTGIADVMDDADAFGGIGNNKEPYQQMTFFLHDSQVEQVKRALALVPAENGTSDVNANNTGNLLAYICASFERDHNG